MSFIKDESGTVLEKEELKIDGRCLLRTYLRLIMQVKEIMILKFSHVHILGPKFFVVYPLYSCPVVWEFLIISLLWVVPLLHVTSMSNNALFIKDEFCT